MMQKTILKVQQYFEKKSSGAGTFKMALRFETLQADYD